MADIKIQWIIAAVMVLGLGVALVTGRIHLYMGPPSWHNVNKSDDPRRFWAFVVGIALSIVVLIVGPIIDQ